MKTIQIALATAATAGTVAIGGGAYALVAGDDEVAVHSTVSGLPQAPKVSVPALPVTPPDCVPAAAIDISKLPADLRSKIDVTKLKAQQETERIRSTLPAKVSASAKVPATQPARLPSKAPTTLPSTATSTTDAIKRLARGVPICSTPTVSVGNPATAVPSARVPQPPALALSCDSVQPAVRLGSPVEQTITTSGGLKFVSAKTDAITAQGRKVCVKVQQWTGPAGLWLKAERLQGQVSLDQVRQALHLPPVKPITMGKDLFWQSPLPGVQGSGIMWSPAPGVVVHVSASTALEGRLQQVATQLHQAR